MPQISRFHGITTFEIASLDRLVGELPLKVERLVKTWASTHQKELLAKIGVELVVMGR